MRLRLAVFCILSTFAAAADERPAGRAASASNTTTVSISNKRGVALQQFEIFVPSPKSQNEKIIGKLPQPLGAGESVNVPLTRLKGCVVRARWSFADAQDAGEVDLCNGAHIVLVD